MLFGNGGGCFGGGFGGGGACDRDGVVTAVALAGTAPATRGTTQNPVTVSDLL